MFKIDDYVVYKKDVCIIKQIKKNHLNGLDYYILAPIEDTSLTIEIPVENRLGFVRKIIDKNEVENIINDISGVEVIDSLNDRALEQTYKSLLNSGNHLDLIKIIKTTYSRKEVRLLNNKKVSEKDDVYFKKAEKLLYNEFAIALGLTFDEAREYVIDKVETGLNN